MYIYTTECPPCLSASIPNHILMFHHLLNFFYYSLSPRLKMYAFWNEESRLASDTLGRLTQLLAVLYSTGTEQQFLYHSTNLLLELTSRSPDFNRSIFDSPLSECKFEVWVAVRSGIHMVYSRILAMCPNNQPASFNCSTKLGSAGGKLGTPLIIPY